MIKRAALAGATVTLAVAVGATYGQAHGTSRRMASSATARFAIVATRRGYPAVGGTAVQAGVQTTTAPFGRGAVTAKTTVTGLSGSTATLKGKSVAYFRRGTSNLTFKGKATINSDGTVTATGSGKLTGGTGAFRGVTGTFKFVSSAASTTSPVKYRSSGTVTFPPQSR